MQTHLSLHYQYTSNPGPMGGNFYNDTPLSFEVELDPNNGNYHAFPIK